MTDDFGTPYTPVETPPKSRNNLVIGIIVVLVVLCCCCFLSASILAWNFGDAVMNYMGVY